MVKKQEMPIFLFFQKQESYEEVNVNLINEEILKLERFARNIDSISQIIQNKFRPYEDLSKIETINADVRSSTEQNKFKRVSKPVDANNAEFYNCSICNYKNNIENTLCLKCNKNNEIVINQISNNLNKKNENLPFSTNIEFKKNNLELNSTGQHFSKNKNAETKSKGFYASNENELAIKTNEVYNNANVNKDNYRSNETPQFQDDKNKSIFLY
jgi:hypothetical protein